jgi:hypothetical protein
MIPPVQLMIRKFSVEARKNICCQQATALLFACYEAIANMQQHGGKTH